MRQVIEHSWKIFGGGLAFALMTGCGGGPAAPQQAAVSAPVLYEWHGDHLTGPVRVLINLTTQRGEIYIGGQPAGWTMVATGKEGFGTPAGSYVILEKVEDKYSTLYGKTVDAFGATVNPDADIRKHKPPAGGEFVPAPMPYWMRLTWRGIGMHAGIIPEPGSPASHGCIRLPEDMARILFHRVSLGTKVTIVR